MRSGLRGLVTSLAGKLTLAFLLVGVLGVLLFAFLVGLRTRTEFDRFLSDRDQAILIDALTDYYEQAGSWAGVREALAAPPPTGLASASSDAAPSSRS